MQISILIGIALFCCISFGCGPKDGSAQSVVRLSLEQAKSLDSIMRHPGWLEKPKLKDVMLAGGIFFQEGDEVFLDGDRVVIRGRDQFKSDVKKMFDDMTIYEKYIKERLEEPSEWGE